MTQVFRMDWFDAKRLSDVALVEEALMAFKDSAGEDNAVGLIQTIVDTYVKEQAADMSAVLTAERERVEEVLLKEEAAEPIPLMQPRMKSKNALKIHRQFMDGWRFRVLAQGLILAADRDDPAVDAQIAALDKAVEELIPDGAKPTLNLIRGFVDGVAARGLLTEVQDDDQNDNEAAG